jgi:lysophospholipase L1-like esterase
MKPRRPLTAAAAAVALAVCAAGPATAGPREASAAAGAYVALGDSYAAGVGAGAYDGDSGDCRRSTAAHPVLWAERNAPASFTFVACLGAVTTDVLNDQLGALDSDTSLVTLSIGGNDAGFADTMETCVLRGTDACLSAVAAASGYIRDTLPGRLDAVYDAIGARAPDAEVVVLGYPRLYELNGDCPLGIAEESRAAVNGASDLLGEVIGKRAADHGFTYGDVRAAFTGHEICSGDAWLHSVTWPLDDSYHPTAAGQSGGYYEVLEGLA